MQPLLGNLLPSCPLYQRPMARPASATGSSCTVRARHTSPQFKVFDHVQNFSVPMVHLPISTLVAPPVLSVAVLAHLGWIQGLLQRNGIMSKVPVLQEGRLQSCKRLAWADKIACTKGAS